MQHQFCIFSYSKMHFGLECQVVHGTTVLYIHIPKIGELVVMHSYLFSHRLRDQVYIRKRKIVAIVKQDAFEGVECRGVINVDAAAIDYIHLAGSFSNSVVDAFGEGGVNEFEVQKHFV